MADESLGLVVVVKEAVAAAVVVVVVASGSKWRAFLKKFRKQSLIFLVSLSSDWIK